jgi:hypothetical protein
MKIKVEASIGSSGDLIALKRRRSLTYPTRQDLNLWQLNNATSKIAYSVVVPPSLPLKMLSVFLTHFCLSRSGHPERHSLLQLCCAQAQEMKVDLLACFQVFSKTHLV